MDSYAVLVAALLIIPSLWYLHRSDNPNISVNPYPGNTGVKIPPVHFCLCISKTVRDTAMRFCDTVRNSEGYLSRINLCRIAAGNVNMAVWKPEVHFTKSAKSRMPDSIVSDYKQPRSKMQYDAQKPEIVVTVVVVVVVVVVHSHPNNIHYYYVANAYNACNK